nr:hypothetical protein [Prevotella sp.]
MKFKHVLLIIEFITTIVFLVLMIHYYGVKDYTHCTDMIFAFLISFAIFYFSFLMISVPHDEDDRKTYLWWIDDD